MYYLLPQCLGKGLQLQSTNKGVLHHHPLCMVSSSDLGTDLKNTASRQRRDLGHAQGSVRVYRCVLATQEGNQIPEGI